MMSVCLLWQKPQTVWIDCPRDEQTEDIFPSVFAAFRRREVVSNRSKSLIRSEGLWQ